MGLGEDEVNESLSVGSGSQSDGYLDRRNGVVGWRGRGSRDLRVGEEIVCVGV